MFAMEDNPSLPSTSSSPQEVPVVSSLVCDSVFALEDNFLLPPTSSPQEVPVVSSLVCDSVFTMEDNFLLPPTSSPQEVPEKAKKQNRKRKSANSSKGIAKKKKDVSLSEDGNSSGDLLTVSSLACSIFNMEDNFLLPSTSSYQQEVPENKKKQKAKPKSSKGKAKKKKEANLSNDEIVSSEHQILCSLTFDSELNMEDTLVFPSTSSQEVPDNKIQQTAKPKSSKRKARKKKGDNTPEKPYERVKRSKNKKLLGLPLDKADQLRLKINEQERNRQRVIREALDDLKQMDIPDILSVDNYKAGSKCHTLKTTIAYIAHMMSQIENHDRVHGVSEYLQRQTLLRQQWLQEKLNVMQQEEAKYQQQQQELEQEILLHQQQLIQQQQVLQPTTNIQLQCDSQLQHLQSDQQQTIFNQPQVQLETQQLLPNLQQTKLLFNPHHNQQLSSSKLFHQQPATIVEQQTTLPENHQQQIPQQLTSTMYQPLPSQHQQHISPQFYPPQPGVQASIPVPLHQQQTHQEQSLLPFNNPSDFPSDLSAPTTSFTPMNSILFNQPPQFVDSNGHLSSMYHNQYQNWEVNYFQQPVFAPQYYPAPMSWAPHDQPFGHVADVNLMNQGQSSKKKPTRKARSKKGKATTPTRAAPAASTTSTEPSDPGSLTGVISKRKKRVLDVQNNIVFDDTSCPTFSDTTSALCLPTDEPIASGSTPSDSGYSSKSINRESDMGVDYANSKDQNIDTKKTDSLLDQFLAADQFFENLDKL